MQYNLYMHEEWSMFNTDYRVSKKFRPIFEASDLKQFNT